MKAYVCLYVFVYEGKIIKKIDIITVFSALCFTQYCNAGYGLFKVLLAARARNFVNPFISFDWDKGGHTQPPVTIRALYMRLRTLECPISQTLLRNKQGRRSDVLGCVITWVSHRWWHHADRSIDLSLNIFTQTSFLETHFYFQFQCLPLHQTITQQQFISITS